MAIENSVSIDFFDLRSSIVLVFSIAAYPVWVQDICVSKRLNPFNIYNVQKEECTPIEVFECTYWLEKLKEGTSVKSTISEMSLKSHLINNIVTNRPAMQRGINT